MNAVFNLEFQNPNIQKGYRDDPFYGKNAFLQMIVLIGTVLYKVQRPGFMRAVW